MWVVYSKSKVHQIVLLVCIVETRNQEKIIYFPVATTSLRPIWLEPEQCGERLLCLKDSSSTALYGAWWETNINCRGHKISIFHNQSLNLLRFRSFCKWINYCQTSLTIWNFIPSIYMHSNNICWEIISIRSRTLSLWSPVAVLLLLYLNISYKWIRFILAALS